MSETVGHGPSGPDKYFSRQEGAKEVNVASEVQLHVCPECSSDLVYPIEWEEGEKQDSGDNDYLWWISLRCPNCEWRSEGEYGQEEADKFDDALNEGNEIFLSALIKLRKSNMEDYKDRFTQALENDHIMPMDF